MNIGALTLLVLADASRLLPSIQKEAEKAGDVGGAIAGKRFGSQLAANVKKSFSGAEIGKGLVQGFGLAGALGAANLASTAVSKFVDVLQDATKAALEDQVSQQKLGTALRENVPNWDGDTKAIEAVLASRIKLGFSDDEQRDSLARLVVATNDVNKALEIQRTAMDLARLRNISLSDATDALTKVEGGQFQLLKGLGIQLEKGATATEALAAVQKAARGQAEDYAKTNAGKMLTAQTLVNEALEKLGYILLPVVAGGFETAGQVVTNFAGAFDVLTGTAKASSPEVQQLADVIGFLTKTTELATFPLRTLIDAWRFILGNAGDIARALGQGRASLASLQEAAAHGVPPARAQLQQLQQAADELGISLDDAWRISADAGVRGAAQIVAASRDSAAAIESAGSGAKILGSRFKDLGDDAGTMGRKVKGGYTTAEEAAAATERGIATANRRIAHSFSSMVKSMVAAAQDAIDGFFDPIETHAEILATRQKLRAAEEARRQAKTRADQRAASDDIIAALDDEATELVHLADQGKLTGKDVGKFRDDTVAAYRAMGKKIPPELQKIIDKLGTLAKIESSSGVTITVKPGKPGLGPAPDKRAGGGPVLPGKAYAVGELREERLVMYPGGGGYVYPTTVGASRDAQREAGLASSQRRDDRVAASMASYMQPSEWPSGLTRNASSPLAVTKSMLPQPAGDTHFHLQVNGDLRARDSDEVLAKMNRLRSISSRPFSGVRH